MCSNEFLLLWTMICDKDDYSLKRRVNGYNYVTKSLSDILEELSTSKYIKSRKNVEKIALYDPTIYQKIAKAVFMGTNIKDNSNLYESYETKLIKRLLWMKYFD